MYPINKLTLLALATITVGCAAPKRTEFRVQMITKSDDGEKLAGVVVHHGKQVLGTTNSAGRLDVAIEASNHSTFDVNFECPKGYAATRDHVVIPLRNAAEVAQEAPVPLEAEAKGDSPKPVKPTASSAYEVTLECKPTIRKAVVVVQANMANVPIMMGKNNIGTTNEEGVAHLSLELRAEEVFELWLDTSSQSLLRPINPEFPFVMPHHDEVFVMQESFTLLDPPKVVVKKKRKKRKKVVVKARPTQIITGKATWGSIRSK